MNFIKCRSATKKDLVRAKEVGIGRARKGDVDGGEERGSDGMQLLQQIHHLVRVRISLNSKTSKSPCVGRPRKNEFYVVVWWNAIETDAQFYWQFVRMLKIPVEQTPFISGSCMLFSSIISVCTKQCLASPCRHLTEPARRALRYHHVPLQISRKIFRRAPAKQALHGNHDSY